MAEAGEEKNADLEELEKQKWYHGLLPRKDIVELLKEDGDFLVRYTQKGGFQIVVTHLWKGEIIHMMLQKDPVKNVYRMPNKDFHSVVELVNYYRKGKRPFNEKGALLVKPVPKKAWLISHKDVELSKKIGEGNFGEVFLGTMNFGQRKIPVAVKSCKTVVGEDQRDEFMKEAKMMLLYRHDNVVRIYAIAADKPPLLMVMEHCPEGGLDRYLQKNSGKITPAQKVTLCAHAARGMEYLHVKKNCIHRDLAARNCLMGAKNVLKIADFGLTRQGEYKLQRKGAAVPIRWTAPEALTSSVFNKESDVWSFGIMMWEIFADAAEPWPNMTPKEAFKAMRAGTKMDMPPGTPEPTIRVMHATWALEPPSRPNMAQIRQELDRQDKDLNPATPDKTE